MARRNAGTIFISLRLAMDEFKAGINQATRYLNKFEKDAMRAGHSLSLALTIPLGVFGRTAIRAFGEFDKAMTDSIAIMRTVDSTMRDKLVKRAKEIGVATGFSPAKIAEGYKSLAQAGYDAEQSLQSIGTVAVFARASDMDLVKASELLAATQTALGLKTGDAAVDMANMARIADVLTLANFDGTASTEDFAQALGSKLAGQLRIVGMSLEEGSAALVAFARNNIKGREAGTQLGIVLRDIQLKALANAEAWKAQGIAVYNAQGQMRPFAQIIQDFEAKLGALEPAQRQVLLSTLGFTQKNMAATQALVGFGAEMQRFAEKAGKAGMVVSEVAAKKLTSFSGQMDIAKARIEVASYALGEILAPMLLATYQGFATVAEKLADLNPRLQEAIVIVGLLAAALGPLKYALAGVAAVMNFMLNHPVLVAIALIAALAYAFRDELGAGIEAGIEAFIVFKDTVMMELEGLWTGLTEGFNEMVDAIGVVFSDIGYFFSTIGEAIWEAFNFLFNGWFTQAIYSVFKELFSALWDIIVFWGEGIGRIFGEMFDLAVKDLKAFGQGWVDVWLVVKTILGWILTGIDEMFNFLTFGRWENVKQWATQTWLRIIDEIQNAIRKIKEFFGLAAEAGKRTAHAVETGLKNAKVAGEYAWNSAYARRKAKREKEKGTFGDVGSLTDVLQTATGVNQTFMKVGENINTINRSGDKAWPAMGKGLKEVQAEGKKTADVLDNINDKINKARAANVVERNKEALNQAVEKGDQALFNSLEAQYRQSVADGVTAGYADSLEKLEGDKKKHAEAQANIEKFAAEEAYRERDKLQNQLLENYAKKMKEAHENAVKTFEGIFDDLFSNDDEGKFFSGLASGLAASVASGVEEGVKDAQDAGVKLGETIAEAIASYFQDNSSATAGGSTGGGGGFFGGLFDSASSWFGSGSSGQAAGDGTIPGGVGTSMDGGTMMQDGSVKPSTASSVNYGSYAQAGVGLYNDIRNARKLDKEHKDNRGTGGAVGGGVGAIIGSIFGNPAVGQAIGSTIGRFVGKYIPWGPQNKQTNQRHSAANYIEDEMAKWAQVSFFGRDGKMRWGEGSKFNFLEGSVDRFNDPNWGASMETWGEKAKGTFLGLGEAIKEFLGLTEKVGAQIGFILGENLAGNIDNARLMVQYLGLSFEDLQKALLNAARQGKMSWHDYNVNMQGVAEAFKPGIAAAAAWTQAMQNLHNSGGRGVAALKAFRDVAVEGIEGKLKTLEELRTKLLSEAKTQQEKDEINAMFEAAKNRGIKTLEEWAKADDDLAGSIVGDMYALNKNLAEAWDEMGKNIDNLTEKLKAIPEKIESNVKLTFTSEMDDDTRAGIAAANSGGADIPTGGLNVSAKAARGGLLSGPTFMFGGGKLGLAGEAGMEAIMPLTRVGGRLGVAAQLPKGSAGGTTIVINAPNAEAGVEGRILAMIEDMRDGLLDDTIAAVVAHAR